ncbi:hypothetical protein MY10362_007901 [Beauveria mimosiformis]
MLTIFLAIMLLAWIAVRRVSSLYVQSVFSLPPAQIKEVSPGTLDSIAKECNGVRAQAQLQQLPTALDTYKQHADKMTTPGRKLRAIGDGSDAEPAAKNVQMALDNIDSVCAWAMDRKLLWAFELYCLDMSMFLAGSLGSWDDVVEDFTEEVASVVMPLLSEFGGGWPSMTDEQRAAMIKTLLELGVTFTIKGIQGTLRLNVFRDDLGGFTDCCKAFFGFESVIKGLPSTA